MPIRSRDELTFYRQADLASSGIPRWGLIQWLRCDVMRFQRLLRKTEYLANRYQNGLRKWFVLGLRWILKRRGRRLGLEIPLNVFGPGLAIVHPCGIVVSAKARVGKNCRIHAGVNVGEHRLRAPVIGDNVYLGPGAKIVGGVTIGDNAVIGANALVVKDVPPGVTVGAHPAEIIAKRDSREIIPRRGA
jgi:serine O-acetyltransferase